MKKIVLVALLAVSFTGFSQQGKIGFQKGQKLEVVTDVKKTSTVEFGGMPIESKVNATLTEIFDVKDVTASGSVMEHKVKRLTFNAEGMQGNQTFDSEKESDMSGEMGKFLEKSIKNKYTVTLDASGKVSSVKLDDDNPNAKNEEADAVVGLISMQTGLNLTVPDAGEVTAFSILPSKSVNKGDSWTDTTAGEGEKRKVLYTVNNLTDNEILLDFKEESAIDTKTNIGGQEAIISSKSNSTGTITLDRKTGILKTKTATGSSEGSVEVQGQNIPMSEKSTVTITVK